MFDRKQVLNRRNTYSHTNVDGLTSFVIVSRILYDDEVTFSFFSFFSCARRPFFTRYYTSKTKMTPTRFITSSPFTWETASMIFMFHSLFFSFLSFAFCTSIRHVHTTHFTFFHLGDGILDIDFGSPWLQILLHHLSLSCKGVVKWKLLASLLILSGLLLRDVDQLLLQYLERHSMYHFRLRKD